MSSKLDLLQGTLDLMVLQTLASMGALHGYGIARRIEQVSGDEVLLEPGHDLCFAGAAAATGMDRRQVGHLGEQPQGEVLFNYRSGRKQLAEDAAYWNRLSGVMGRVLAMSTEGEK